MLCKKCVLPESKPDIVLNGEGICNICIDFEKRKAFKQGNVILESEVIKILNKYRGKGRYDCLVMCSGGKDSTLALYYMKKRYKMNPLAFTFDHGFENEEALTNIKNAVNILGVDWVYYKSDFMKDVFTKIIELRTRAPICHVCAIWYLWFTHDLAYRFNIPLIIAGWTKGQSLHGGETGVEYNSMSTATSDFIANYLHKYPAYRDFPQSIKEVLTRSRRKFKTEAISPHWVLPYDPDRIKEILEAELKWKTPQLSYPLNSTNCIMNFVSVYLCMKNFGFTHYHIEMSKLIRLGELTREEAIKLLEINFDEKFINTIVSKVGCNLKD